MVVLRETALAEPVGMVGRYVNREQRKGGQGRRCEGSFDLDLRHVSDSKKVSQLSIAVTELTPAEIAQWLKASG